ncbi:hypothetical protein V493_04332 [Pseudogymnoascus sp. VKM F-4281 (FW-2241)]|nr:hypothetical protein V493_04332 [Pseudogymnoascus sp. VKM F-4281 (FW-2241)]
MENDLRREGTEKAPIVPKRRNHKKSRGGCGNCKIRSVKCDETKPGCKRCTAYGVSCSYNPNAANLQPLFGGTTMIKQDSPKAQRPITQAQANQTRLSAFPRLANALPVVSDDYAGIEMDTQSLERLRRFHLRIVPTMGCPKVAKYFFSHAIRIACSAPYVMHLIQALTSLHDRHCSGQAHLRQTAFESYHLSHAAAQFNRKLSAPLAPADRDPVWAAACTIGWIVFCSIDATQASEAWPLAPSKSSDLDWIRMNDAKALLWGITNPTRADSMFSTVSTEFAAGMNNMATSNWPVCCCRESAGVTAASRMRPSELHNLSILPGAHAAELQGAAGREGCPCSAATSVLVCEDLPRGVVGRAARDARVRSYLHLSRAASWRKCGDPGAVVLPTNAMWNVDRRRLALLDEEADLKQFPNDNILDNNIPDDERKGKGISPPLLTIVVGNPVTATFKTKLRW